MLRMCVLVLVVVGCGRPAPVQPTPPGAPGELVKPVVVEPPKTGSPAPEKEKPAPEFPPDDWTHRDLMRHLGAKGVRLELRSVPEWNTPDKVAAFLSEGIPNEPTMLVFLCRDKNAARDQAGAMGDGAFHAGRFALGPPPNPRPKINDVGLLRRVQRALN